MLNLSPIQLAEDHWLWVEYDKNYDGSWSVFFFHNIHGIMTTTRFDKVLKILASWRVDTKEEIENRVKRYFGMMGLA